MSLALDAPKDSFRLSKLIYDTRYRSYTIQVVVLALLLVFLGWVTDNTVRNLAERGKDINFDFLWQRAGYDIDQQLIPYTNDSTHGRALVIGLLNTLVLAFFGCIGATILGTIAGILRLSKSWVVARLMTFFVEIFRNVPLVLWIVLVFTIFSEVMPQPKDFKVTDEMIAAGEAPAASTFLGIALTNRSANIPAPILDRPLGTVEIATVPISLSVVAFLLVVGLSIWFNRRLLAQAKAVQEATGERPVTWWKSLLILFVPAIALLLAMGIHLEYPELKGFNFVGGIKLNHSFTAMLIALVLYTAFADVAETVRAGIMAISRGQTEAAYAMGLRPGQTMKLVILPQALRVIVPPMISNYLSLTKNTSLGIAVSYLDLRGTLGGITMNQTGREMECMLLMMAIYLVISLLTSVVMNIYNNSVKLKER